ncbi:MAG: hypothetical protein EXR10_01660 [Alphaproteobacteria bacterium]|nr:hypothetical protein [Alphaproteobacteria bacterium]
MELGEFLDLVASPSHEQVFNPVCSEIISAIIDDQREPWSAVAAIIRSWQSAWKPARQGRRFQREIASNRDPSDSA